jgi:hypothetical protein
MPKPNPPYNYNWVGNTLTFNLPSDATGVKIEYQKDGTTNWITVLDSPNSPVTSCTLNSSHGPIGTVCGLTAKEKEQGGKEWSDRSCETITNTP